MSIILEALCPGAVHVDLPNPSLGDTDQVNIKTKFKMSMSSEIYSYLNTPAVTKFLVTFTGVSTALITQLLVVLKAGAGYLFTYTDYDTNSYTVKVLNNPFERVADGRNPCSNWNEHHSFTLELEVIP